MIDTINAKRSRYHKIDGWRGYWLPPRAIAGASDTGTWSDSPAPTPDVIAELDAFKAHLRKHKVKYRSTFGVTSNVFAGKRWITVVDFDDFARAAQLTVDYLADHPNLQFLHDADLDAFGFKAYDGDAEETGAPPVTHLPADYFGRAA